MWNLRHLNFSGLRSHGTCESSVTCFNMKEYKDDVAPMDRIDIHKDKTEALSLLS